MDRHQNLKLIEAKNVLLPVLINGEPFGTNEHFEALTTVLDAIKMSWHHPGTDKTGHMITDCELHNCSTKQEATDGK